jgi:hypothetical protein
MGNVGQWLVITAFIALVLSVGSTLVAAWFELDNFGDYLALTEALLSWEVIAGGLAIGAGSTFKSNIAGLIDKLAS